MANQHAVSANAVTVVTTAETVVATLAPFNYNQPAGANSQGLTGVTPQVGPEGVLLDGNINLLVGTGGTAVTVRVRQGSLTGAVVGGSGSAYVQSVTAAQTVNVPIAVLDAAPVAQPVYVVTVQLTAASANSTVNYAAFSAIDANSFE